jgi:2-polyprenyl-3-methyl-5-hydroxy-6-metoxy-1,4-benzoquinol methylase
VARPLDAVDFNKSCEECRGVFLAPSNSLITYYLCQQCGFCFAPEFLSWNMKDFSRHIYNRDYLRVDPDYKEARPTGQAEMIESLLGQEKAGISHLDYGSGEGLLTRKLRKRGWKSDAYDPFVSPDLSVQVLGSYDLVTAFEVFEHVPDVDGLMSELALVTKRQGILLFSTLLSDGQIRSGRRLDWWYASPRNGHVSLYSSTSLAMVLAKKGFKLVSLSPGLHVAFIERPEWAANLRAEPKTLAIDAV